MARKSDINLRLTTQGKEDLKRALRETGEEGRKMADQLDRAGKKGSRGLKAVDEAAREARGGLEGMTDRLGPLGAGLRALGPYGLAAGAAIGGTALAIGAAVRVGKEAVDTFAQIGNEADRMGLSAETFQALTAEFEAQGLSVSRLDTGMSALQERQAQIVDQQGELYSRLKDTNPELLKQLQGLTRTEDMLRAVTKALGEAESQTERNRIAYAAFGEAGTDVQKVLLATEGGIDGLIQKGAALGLVIEDDLIRRSQTLSTEFDITSKVIDLQLKAAFVDFGPVALQMIGWLGDIAEKAARVADHFRSVSERSSEFNQDAMLNIGQRIANRVGGTPYGDAMRSGRELALEDFDTSGMRRGVIQNLVNDIDEFNEVFRVEMARGAKAARQEFEGELRGFSADALEEELAAIEAALAELDAQQAAYRERAYKAAGSPPLFDPQQADQIDAEAAGVGAQARQTYEDRREVVQALIEEARRREANADAAEREREAVVAAERAAAEAKRKAAEEERELLALKREAAAVLATLATEVELLAEKEAHLKAMVDEKFLTQDQADAAMKAYREEIMGVTDAVAEWVSVVESGRSPVEALQDQIEKLQADLDAGRISVELYSSAYRTLKAAIKDAAQADREASEDFQAAADIKEQLAEAAAAKRSLDESMEVERARVRRLVEEKELTSQEGDDWLDLYAEKIREARREIDLWAEAESILDGVQQNRIKTMEDVGRALVATMLKMVQAAAQAQAAAGTGGGFLDFLGGVGSRMLGAFGFGGGKGAGTAGNSLHAGAGVPTSHSGSVVGQPSGERRSLGMLAGDERVRVVRRNQEIVTDADRRQIIDFVEAAGRTQTAMPASAYGAERVEFTINTVVRDESGRASVKATQTGERSMDLEVAFGDQVKGVAASGGLDDILTKRGFVQDRGR